MRIILKNIFLLLFLLAANTGRAQIISAYSFSPIMGSGSSMMNGGYSVELSGYLKCIQVTTGLNIFSIPDKNNGSFGSCCIVPAAIAILASVISAYYYLRVIKVMYFDELRSRDLEVIVERNIVFIAIISTLFNLFFFIYPAKLFDITIAISESIFR